MTNSSVRDGVGHKQCSKCALWLSESTFYKDSTTKDRLGSSCKNCIREYNKQHYAHNRDKRLLKMSKYRARTKDQEREKALIRKYGITLSERDALLEAQEGTCAICRCSEPAGHGWCVDHDHETGAVRGILCSPCNLILGHAKDNLDVLISAINYLEKNS